MKFDTVIIGGGLAGLFAANRLQSQGARTALFVNGAPGLSFSSGNIDFFKGYQPLTGWKEKLTPKHPYFKCGVNNILPALTAFQQLCQDENIFLQAADENFQVATSYGRFKESFLVQPSMILPQSLLYNIPQQNSREIKFDKKTEMKIGIAAIRYYQDFPSHFIASGFAHFLSQAKIEILPLEIGLISRYFYFRSKDIAQFLSIESNWQNFLRKLDEFIRNYDILFIPAILPADEMYHERWQEINAKWPGRIVEIPTSPPSVAGERLLHALKRAYLKKGGHFYENRKVLSAKKQSGKEIRILSIDVAEMSEPIEAENFILASGSFFSNGLQSRADQIIEPIFSLDTFFLPQTENWSAESFKDFSNHHLLTFGVEINNNFQPSIDQKTVANLFCSGSVLAHYNPLQEGSSGGVAICSAFSAVEKINQRASSKIN